MTPILHILSKEFRQFRRDHRMVALSLVVPVVQLILLGYAANLDVRDVPTVVCDLDRSPQSRALVERVANSGYFSIVGREAEIGRVDAWLDGGRARMAIVVPAGFGSRLAAGRTASLQAVADGAASSTATIGLSYLGAIVSGYSREVLAELALRRGGALRAAGVAPEVRVWYNPELRSRDFMVPGILALLLMVLTTISTSLALVKEKESGTMEQLSVTPIRPYQLIIGKLAPFTIIGMVDAVLVLAVTRFWFEVPVRGSVWLLLGLCLLFLMSTLGLGLLVSTISANQQQAMMTSIFFVILPMVFLSGFVFPIENMPGPIQAATYLLPLRYFFVIIRGVVLKGAGIVELWDEAAALALFGVVILSVSILRFRKTAA